VIHYIKKVVKEVANIRNTIIMQFDNSSIDTSHFEVAI
jgi:hypothetical protein